MKEAQLSLHGTHCVVNNLGRITVENPYFTATVSELETLALFARGLTYDQIALARVISSNSVRRQMESARKANRCHNVAKLTAVGTELDLLNPLAIEGVRVQSVKLQIHKSRPINITAELNTLPLPISVDST